MKIKITSAKSLHNQPVKPDSVHETDENTARNLIKKGFAVAHDDEAKGVNLEDASRLSPDQAECNIEAQVDAREAKKAKDDEAKAAKKKNKR